MAAMMAFVAASADMAYAVPRDPAPMTRIRGGIGNSCLPGALRKPVLLFSNLEVAGLSDVWCRPAEAVLGEGILFWETAELCLNMLRIMEDSKIEETGGGVGTYSERRT